MRVVIKKPGKTGNVQELTVEQIQELVSPCGAYDFIKFNKDAEIGMYSGESFDNSFSRRNFIFKNNIVYGPVVFVGLDKDGRAKDLSVRQMAIIDNYMNHNAIAG